MSFWGRELPISVYVVKKSGGETAMAVDSAAGTLIKGRFSPGAEKCELFVSELLGDKIRSADSPRISSAWLSDSTIA